MEIIRNLDLNFGPRAAKQNELSSQYYRRCRACCLPVQTYIDTPTRTSYGRMQSWQCTGEEELKPGTLVAGRYEIISLIGSGGMGVIYKAKYPGQEKYCAVKMMHRNWLDDRALKRFKQEAKATGQLHHSKLVTVRDFGFIESGQPFMVMDFIEGLTLSDVLKHLGSLHCMEAVKIFLQICDGMQHAHSHGVLHRDLKPSNIMLTELETLTPGAKVIDFGIAKFETTVDSNADELTYRGEILGSPLYMSPEQAAGRHVDKRSDIYSAGCLMFETLTGKPPFKGNSSLETMIQHMHNNPPTLADRSPDKVFPKKLDAVVQKSLAKNPAHRHQSMLELRSDLLCALTDIRNSQAVSTMP